MTGGDVVAGVTQAGPGADAVHDYERLPAHHETIVYGASITMSRRLAGSGKRPSRTSPE